MDRDQAIVECKTMNLHTLEGDEPHGSWGGWLNFLDSCELRGSNRNVFWFGNTNCNYTVIRFKSFRGLIVHSFSFYSEVAFKKNRWKALVEGLLEDIAGLKALATMVKDKTNKTVAWCAGEELRKNAFGGRFVDISKVLERL